MKRLGILFPLATVALFACSHDEPPGPPGGTGGQSIGTVGAGGEAPDGGSTGSVYYDAGSYSAFPDIPSDCVEQDDAGLNPLLTEFTCPVDEAQAKNCANVPYPCPNGQPCQQPPDGKPYRYACSNHACFQGCADVPCPNTPCPLDKPSLWTCGPNKPDVDATCEIILVTDGDKPYTNRYSVCCTF